MTSIVQPLDQSQRVPCSVPLNDADLGLDNANWMKGLQAMTDWCWSGNLSPAPFPNHLARYFLQIPGIFEHQLHFSTSLIFDEPSFRNGIQVSGFIARPVRELIISYLGQKRRSWYTMTHHAVLGALTARKHGISDSAYTGKIVHLPEFRDHASLYTEVERRALHFADCFATNTKAWTDRDCADLKGALREDNLRRFGAEGAWMANLDVARAAYRRVLARGESPEEAQRAGRSAAQQSDLKLRDEQNELLVNAQLVELAFICVQFVALTDVFTGLNIPDEPFLPDVMKGVLAPEVIARLNELCQLGGDGLPELVPPGVPLPLDAILNGDVVVAPAPVRGARVPLTSYEVDEQQRLRDKGLAVGGIQVGTFGWNFGAYFPGGLIYLLVNHPELARYEAPYSLPLLFDEDSWRNGTQVAGFVSRRLKEITILRIYTTTRSRYGLEHHTLFLHNCYRDDYGVGRPPRPTLSQEELQQATTRAVKHADEAMLYVDEPERAPRDTYTDLELATMAWVRRMITHPHTAYQLESRLRGELDAENRREVEAGIRRLDTAPAIGTEAAYKRLLDHQVAELAMVTGHMDGLGRAMTMLRLESELPVTRAEGYWTDRPSLFQVYGFLGIGAAALTANELRLNPVLCEQVQSQLEKGKRGIRITAEVAEETAEF